jgi:hypothetical protein
VELPVTPICSIQRAAASVFAVATADTKRLDGESKRLAPAAGAQGDLETVRGCRNVPAFVSDDFRDGAAREPSRLSVEKIRGIREFPRAVGNRIVDLTRSRRAGAGRIYASAPNILERR